MRRRNRQKTPQMAAGYLRHAVCFACPSLKIGIRISPRTVRQYMPTNPERPTVPSQRWMTFVRNHAKAIIASDFFIVVTATFSARLCARDGGRDSAHPSCQRDTPSHSRVDNATVPRMCDRRRRLQVHHSRPGQHLFQRTGFLASIIGFESLANALPVSASVHFVSA